MNAEQARATLRPGDVVGVDVGDDGEDVVYLRVVDLTAGDQFLAWGPNRALHRETDTYRYADVLDYVAREHVAGEFVDLATRADTLPDGPLPGFDDAGDDACGEPTGRAVRRAGQRRVDATKEVEEQILASTDDAGDDAGGDEPA